MARRKELSDEQWKVIDPLLPKRRRRSEGAADHRKMSAKSYRVINGVNTAFQYTLTIH